jgi:hypothetical protein
LRIYSIHIAAILAVWLGMYFPGLDVLLAVVYMFCIWREGVYGAAILQSPWKVAAVAGFWQLPGFILGGSVWLGLEQWADSAYYAIFILQLWQTPVLPLISLLPQSVGLEKPLYYYLIFAAVFILAVVYTLPALRLHPKN